VSSSNNSMGGISVGLVEKWLRSTGQRQSLLTRDGVEALVGSNL